MKKIFLPFAVAVICGLVRATPDLPPAAKPDVSDTEITAQLLEYRPEYDANGGLLVYSGGVRVQNPRMKLLCDRLVIYLPKSGEQPNRIEAQTNVVIIKENHGETTRATCSLAVYTRTVRPGVTNAIITLTGDPLPFIESPSGTTEGSPITWNLTTDTFSGSNTKTTIKMKSFGGGGTNQSQEKLF
jgi:lipopolysaccharide export system protein LptA